MLSRKRFSGSFSKDNDDVTTPDSNPKVPTVEFKLVEDLRLVTVPVTTCLVVLGVYITLGKNWFCWIHNWISRHLFHFYQFTVFLSAVDFTNSFVEVTKRIKLNFICKIFREIVKTLLKLILQKNRQVSNAKLVYTVYIALQCGKKGNSCSK